MGNKEFNTAWVFFGLGFAETLGILLPRKGISLDQIENVKPFLGILNNTASSSSFKVLDISPLLASLPFIIGFIWFCTLYKAWRSDNKWLKVLGFILGLCFAIYMFSLIP